VPDERALATANRRTEREARRAARRGEVKVANLLPGYAADGKTLRGARRSDGGRVHLLALVAHTDGSVRAQRQIPAKGSEISALDPLLRQATATDLVGAVLTADAPHTQRESARCLVEDHHGHYVLIVKANQPTLHAATIKILTGPDTAFAHLTPIEHDRGHDRSEQRITRVTAAEGLDFPHAAQVFRILRYRGGLDGQRRSKEVVYGITDLTAKQAGAAQIATYVRGHWNAIENGTHHVRDVTFHEDAGQARTGTIPVLWPPSATLPSAPCGTRDTSTSPMADVITPMVTSAPSTYSRSRLMDQTDQITNSPGPWVNSRSQRPWSVDGDV
jgi:Transposase DDE domain